MRSTSSGPGIAALGLAVLLAGCHRVQPPAAAPLPTAIEIADRLFEAGDLPAAAAAYESVLASGGDGSGAGMDRALFRLAVIELSDAANGTAPALRRLRELVSRHPASPYRVVAERLLSLEAEARRLRQQLEALKAIDLEPPGG